MRRIALPRTGWIVGLGCASLLLSSLCGCSWNDVFPPQLQTLQNSDAVDRAMRLCSLREGDHPFHLVLEIGEGPLPETKPAGHSGPAGYSYWKPAPIPLESAKPVAVADMRARVEIFWLSAISYRVQIHSRDFDQIRIVNGNVTEEHNTGDFYPRWIQNFVDAILNPVPQVETLRNIPGSVPVGVKSHACISNAGVSDGQSGESDKPIRQPEETSVAQVCFQDAEPRIASGVEFTRSVWFDDFAPFGRQQIARTLVNNLPANVLVRGQISVLERLREADYPLLKAHEFTPPEQLIETTLVDRNVAQAMLDLNPAPFPRRTLRNPEYAEGTVVMKPASFETGAAESNGADGHVGAAVKSPMTVYIRTDKTGKVREAYRNTIDQFGLTDAAVARAMKLKFKPLIVDGVARQMEAPILLAK
jgi:hypothetical protein